MKFTRKYVNDAIIRVTPRGRTSRRRRITNHKERKERKDHRLADNLIFVVFALFAVDASERGFYARSSAVSMGMMRLSA